jgi:hypothetical protein
MPFAIIVYGAMGTETNYFISLHFRGQDVKFIVYETKSKGQTWQTVQDDDLPEGRQLQCSSLNSQTPNESQDQDIELGMSEAVPPPVTSPPLEEEIVDAESSAQVSTSHPSPGGCQWSVWRTSCIDECNVKDDRSSSSDEESDLLDMDPGLYAGKRVNEQVIKLLINRPCHPAEGFLFPKTDGRQCSRSCFFVSLPDKSRRKRQWISYSISRDRLYCLDCLLFGGPINSVWAQDGYNTWSNLNRDVQLHDTCPQHRAAEGARISWLYGRTLDTQLTAQRAATVESNRRATFAAIKALQWLATEMCAIRGNQANDGKFMSLYKQTVLACEREATLSLKPDEIVDNLATQSAALKKHLL